MEGADIKLRKKIQRSNAFAKVFNAFGILFSEFAKLLNGFHKIHKNFPLISIYGWVAV